jgi:RNA polymerase sigma-70 factor (ECF subfamily)
MSSDPDQEVIASVLEGDVDAYAVLVERYQKAIYNMMYRMTRCQESALDLSQDTFIKAYEQLHRFRQGSRFFPWLYTIGLNISRNHLRRDKSSRHVPIEDWEPCSGGDGHRVNEEALCAQLDLERLEACLLQLPPDYREAIILRYREELSLEDVAAALNISLSGAKMRVHRGLRKLRVLMEDGSRKDSDCCALHA